MNYSEIVWRAGQQASAVRTVRAAVWLFVAFKHNVYLLSTEKKSSVNEGATWEMLCVFGW